MAITTKIILCVSIFASAWYMQAGEPAKVSIDIVRGTGVGHKLGVLIIKAAFPASLEATIQAVREQTPEAHACALRFESINPSGKRYYITDPKEIIASGTHLSVRVFPSAETCETTSHAFSKVYQRLLAAANVIRIR